MSLSGNLGFVSLDEVLRLLNRSNQRGMLAVQGDGTEGRVFFDRGGVTLATTYSDADLADHIGRSGMTDGAALTSLLREMAVDTIYKLGASGRTFEVSEHATAPYAQHTPFDLEQLLADARRRLDEWTEVSSVVTDLDTLIRMRRDLGTRDEVTVDRDSWRLISEVGHGASVSALARELGTTEFWAARVAAGLMGEGLLEMETAPHAERRETAREWSEPAPTWAEPAPEPQEPETVEAPQFMEDEAQTAEAVAAEPVFAKASEPEPATHDEREVDPNQSWWREPTADAPKDESPPSEVEEDTEAFLEKVFSGLESNENQEEGYGLLRRRRMGTLRDLSNDT